MHIATIIPIARGIPFDTLTYYAPEPLEPGTLVTIPFGRQTLYGIITETIPLIEAKAFVKQAAFSLKKIKSIIGHVGYFEAIIAALKETASATLSPLGAVASAVLPQILFEYIAGEKVASLLSENTLRPLGGEKKSLVGTRASRVDEYKRMIRSSFASKESVLFIAPTIRSLEWWKSQLEKGIGRHVMIFHSKVTKKMLRSQFAAIKNDNVPFLVFATPGFSVVPVTTIGSVVLEDESSDLYHTSDRYESDTRVFFAALATRIGATLIYGDTLPRFETLAHCGADRLPRSFIPDKLHIVPVEHYRTVLPTEVIELIRHAEKKKRRLFLYTNRKGIAPLSRCADCGTVVECPECSLPMALRFKTSGGTRERLFLCLHCSTTLPPDHTCSYCGGWNIVPVAIGTESLKDAVAHIVGEDSVVAIDDDISPDSKTIEDILKTIESKKFAVIVGTQKALPYIKRIHYAVIPFFDRLYSIPSLYTTESLLRLVMQCNEIAIDGVIICTKNPDVPFVTQLETQKTSLIMTEELTLRKDLGYPPFGTLLKISVTVPEGHHREVLEKIQEYIHDLDQTMLPARRISISSMKVLLSWLVKVPNEYLEEEGRDLMSFFESLRFPFKIERNPERL